MPVFKNHRISKAARKLRSSLDSGVLANITAGKRARQQVASKNREIAELRRELARARGKKPSPEPAPVGTPVFFIVGHQKSGTTWLMKMLDAHPEILCQGEGRPFGKNFRQERKKGQRGGYPPVSLYAAISGSEDLRSWIERSVWTKRDRTDEHLDNLTRLAIEYFLTQKLLKTDKRLVGDKTVLLGPNMVKEIGVVFPDAKVIHIIRDGRDVAVSTMHHIWNQAEDQGGNTQITPEQKARREAYREDPRALIESGGGIFPDGWLGNYARAWKNRVGKTVATGPAVLGENYTEVKYEDLLQRPAEEVGRLLRFLGADASERNVRRCVGEAAFEKLSEGRKPGEEAPSFFRKGIAGDWKNVFTEENRRDFKAAAGDFLIELGYESDDDW